MGENRAGFTSKAIFMHPEGQRVRNALTDANGRSIGRMSIQTSFNAADAMVPAGTADRDRVVAARTARGHNSGSVNPARNTIMADPYVIAVLVIWDRLQAAQQAAQQAQQQQQQAQPQQPAAPDPAAPPEQQQDQPQGP